MDTKTSETLKELIHQQEQRILASFPEQKRWGLLELARAMDAYVFYVIGLDERERKLGIGGVREHLYKYGWNKALSLFMDQSCLEQGAPLVQSFKESQEWADSVIQHCGRLGSCQMMLDLCRYGLADLSTPSLGELRFSLRGSALGVEAMEREEFEVFRELAVEIDNQAWSDIWSHRNDIMMQMNPLVSPWREHYIQYQTNPEIDGYYEALGLLWARRHYEPGQDAFPPDITFGGLPFTLYKAVVVELIGWALKHMDFCQALLLKHPNLQLRNILTITQNEMLLRGWMSAALDVTWEEAVQGLDTLKLTLENKHLHTSVNAGNAAPFLSIGHETVIKSIAGTLVSPFDFMLAELRRRYPQDWDRAVDQRERYFRRELYVMFPGDRFLTFDRPVKLRNESEIVTDIDAVVLDTSTGVLGLFQLKWQDPFGSSMRKRESKKVNFLREGNKWVSAVMSIVDSQPQGFKQLLGDRKGDNPNVIAVRLFVLGRHFAHFSGETTPDPRAAWGLWPQVLRLVKESYEGSDPITWLYTALQERSPLRRDPPMAEGYEMQIGKYRIVFESLQ